MSLSEIDKFLSDRNFALKKALPCNMPDKAAEKPEQKAAQKQTEQQINQPASPELFYYVRDAVIAQPTDQLDLRTVSPLSLAYIGDAVYELIMREYLLRESNAGSQLLHSRAVKLVNSHAQARAAEHILPMLSEQELEAFKRGRNTHTGHVPKGSNNHLYHMATALECLFGYLHLKNQGQRIHELSGEIFIFLNSEGGQQSYGK